MNHFNFHRFSLVLNWVLRVNWRRLVFGVAGSAAGVLIGELAIRANETYYHPYSLIYTYAQLGSALILIGTIVMVCGVTSTVNEKRKRSAFLMLPATNLEKFLALVGFTAVVCPLCLFLSFALGDTLRMAFFWLQGAQNGIISVTYDDGTTWGWWSSAVPLVVENLTPNNFGEFRWLELLYFVTWVVFAHSWYTFFGTLVRKYAFVISNIVFIGAALLLFQVLERYGDHLWLFNKTWEHGVYVSHYNTPLIYWVIAVQLALACLGYWASFRIFKNFQLIPNKWTNV